MCNKLKWKTIFRINIFATSEPLLSCSLPACATTFFFLFFLSSYTFSPIQYSHFQYLRVQPFCNFSKTFVFLTQYFILVYSIQILYSFLDTLIVKGEKGFKKYFLQMPEKKSTSRLLSTLQLTLSMMIGFVCCVVET